MCLEFCKYVIHLFKGRPWKRFLGGISLIKLLIVCVLCYFAEKTNKPMAKNFFEV